MKQFYRERTLEASLTDHGYEVSIYNRSGQYIIRTMGFVDVSAAFQEARRYIDLVLDTR